MDRIAAVVTLALVAACGRTPVVESIGESGQCLSTPSARATLAAASAGRVFVTMDAADRTRPSLVHGRFRVNAPDALGAARVFLALHGADLRVPGADDLALETTRQGLAGTYFRFGQRHRGLPVFGGEVVVHVATGAAAFEVRDVSLGQYEHARLADVTPLVGEERARALAIAATGVAPDGLETSLELGIAPVPAARLAWRVQLGAEDPPSSFEVIVDAIDGAILERRDLLQHATGTGLVYDPNPIASTGDASLRPVAEYAEALAAARFRVELARLDGTGFLAGPWVNSAPRARTRAKEESLTFDYDRTDTRFRQVMAYFHVDRTQARLQDLGFRSINARAMVVNVDASRDDNSYYDPRTKQITTGTGGVPDAEDADVLVHEYGHAIQDHQVPGFGYGDQGAMGEGFGDYIAANMAALGGRRTGDPACMAEWNAAGIRRWNDRCLRRVDGRLHFPEALRGEVHDDGEIWSGALWAARGAVGPDVLDRLLLESHFLLTRRGTMLNGAAAIVSADRNLFEGAHVEALTRVFTEAGLVRDLTPPADLPVVLRTETISVANPLVGPAYAGNLDDSQTITRPGALGLRVHFTFIDTEVGSDCAFQDACDNVYLYDRRGNLFEILNGSREDVTSVVIPGDVVRVRLVTDASLGKGGYRIDRVEQMGSASCGNGSIEPGESCDGPDLGGATCTSLGWASGTLACRPGCTVDSSACTGLATCGNGRRDGNEECDGTDVGDLSCAALGLLEGALTCTADCRLETSLCNACGNDWTEGREECDGEDLGGRDCAALGFASGPLACSPACTLDKSACVAPVCR